MYYVYIKSVFWFCFVLFLHMKLGNVFALNSIMWLECSDLKFRYTEKFSEKQLGPLNDFLQMRTGDLWGVTVDSSKLYLSWLVIFLSNVWEIISWNCFQLVIQR